MRYNLFILFSAAILFSKVSLAQHEMQLKSIDVKHFSIADVQDDNGRSLHFQQSIPLVDFELDGNLCTSLQPEQWQQQLSLVFEAEQSFSPGVKGKIVFKNISNDTITLSNVVPFGRSDNKIFITGKGDNPISRTHLFLPGRQAVNVIVPDNAWELGFSESSLKDSLSVCALARRNGKELVKGSLHRFETILYPGGSVSYSLYADLYSGVW